MNTTKSRNFLSATLIMAGVMFYSFSNLTFAQEHKSSCCGSGMEKDVVAMSDVSGDSIKKMDMKHDLHNHSGMKNDKENIIREGKIDLKAIDKNKDRKVYQDQMDWNVISDAPGKCPLCKMTLKEVTIKTAKQNLLKNGFKVK